MIKKSILSILFIWIISLVLILIIIIPIFSSTIQGTADGFIHKFRLVSFIRSLGEGNIRPRWLADQALGGGTPTFIYNFSVPYYAVAAINIFVHSIQNSSQIYKAILVIITFISMFLLIDKLYGKKTALITSFAYICAPYFLYSLYTYEAWGEMTSFLFPPLILYQVIILNRLLNNKKKSLNKNVILLRIFLFIATWILFINTHNPSVLESVFPIFILIVCLTNKSIKNLLIISYLIFSSFIISSFFWLPALLLIKWIKYGELILYEVNMRIHQYKDLGNFFSVSFNTLRAGKTNYIDFTPGILILLTVISSLIFFITFFIQKLICFYQKNHQFKYQNKNNVNQIFFAFMLLLITVICLFLTTKLTASLWDLGILNLILYPYRFLFVATFTGTILFAWLIRKVDSLWFLIILFITIIIFARPYTNPDLDHFNFGNHYFEDTAQPVQFGLWTYKNMGTGEFLPIWVDYNFVQNQHDIFSQTLTLPKKIELDNKYGTIVNQKILSERMFFHLSMKESADININTFYYPNWKAIVNNISTPVNKDSSGRILIRVPKGDVYLSLIFDYSMPERFGFLLSLLGVIQLVFFLRALKKYIL